MQESAQKSRLGRGDCPRPCWLSGCRLAWDTAGSFQRLLEPSRSGRMCCALPPIAVRRVSASTLALTRVHRQRLWNVCAPLGAV